MARNDIEDMLDQLRRIKSGGDLNSVKIDQIGLLEVEIRFFRTFIKCNHVVSPDSLVKITKIAQLIMEKVHSVFDGIPDEYKNNHNLERGVLTLLESVQGNTNLRYNYELNDSDMSEYMDCLDKNLMMMCLQWGSLSGPSWTNEEILVRNRFTKKLKIIRRKMGFLRYIYVSEIIGYIDHEKLEGLQARIQFMADNVGQFCLALWVAVGTDDILSKPDYLLCLIVLVEMEMKKIFLGELKASKYAKSRTFKDKKLPKGFSHHLHSLLVYLRNKKIENFPNNVSSRNIDVTIEFLLVFLNDDGSNHVISGNWLNEVMEKAGAIAGDVLYVIQKLLPRSINKNDTSNINVCSIQILEKS